MISYDRMIFNNENYQTTDTQNMENRKRYLKRYIGSPQNLLTGGNTLNVKAGSVVFLPYLQVSAMDGSTKYGPFSDPYHQQ